MNNSVVYLGKDLEAMCFAENYHKWILSEFRGFLGKNIVEVGAGTGSFSKLLLQENIESLTVVEPSEMFEVLEENIQQQNSNIKVISQKAIFADVVSSNNLNDIDSIIYVNVLEHIEDDLLELKLIHKALVRNGRCLIFVPALMSLYGEFDKKVGHYRRYKKSELEEKCALVGFKILTSRYFDFIGIFPWFIKYKLLKSSSLGGGEVLAYDKLIIPFLRIFEGLIKFPIGKNILLVAEKVD